jgi:hypothetical protein
MALRIIPFHRIPSSEEPQEQCMQEFPLWISAESVELMTAMQKEL